MQSVAGWRKNRLSLKLLAYILISSSLFTLLVSGIQLYNDYRADVTKINNGIRHIEHGHLEAVTANLWSMNIPQLINEIKGAMNLPDMVYMEIRELRKTGEIVVAQIGKPQTENTITKSFPLLFGEEKRRIGTLFVVASKNMVYERLLNKAFLILATQTLKTFFVSFLILLIFHRLIMRHLMSLKSDFEQITLDQLDRPVAIDRKKGAHEPVDMFDLLVEAINGMRERLQAAAEERSVAEMQIAQSLVEKETLLQEIHHRVKNNMQVISSLLNLQALNIEDDKCRNVLKESQSRVKAMSAVHEVLHNSDNLSEINIRPFVSRITGTLIQMYGSGQQRIELDVNIEDLSIGIRQASPLGLVINELVSNSLKHAFSGRENGRIAVGINIKGKQLELTIGDDGIGMSDSLDWKNRNTLGLRLVRTLVENQLDGSVEMEKENGTTFVIRFNLEGGYQSE